MNAINRGVVILNYNTAKDAIACIHSILDTLRGGVMIVVVDNCSTDLSYEEITGTIGKRKIEYCTCVKTDYNGGFAYGNNRGIDYLKDRGIEFAVITNADIIFRENTLNRLFEGLEKYQEAVIYAPLVLNQKDKNIPLPWKKSQTFLQYLGIKDTSNNIFTIDELEKNDNPIQVYMVSGCCYGINISKFKKMGAFDENTFLYNEEGTVAKAAQNYRYKTYIDTNAIVIHNHGTSTGRQNMFVDTELIMSGLYYWRKYERASSIQVFILWLFFIMKISAKIMLRRYSGKGYMRMFLRTWKRLLEVCNIPISSSER